MSQGAMCDECGSAYEQSSSQMSSVCPECAHYIYGYENCAHEFSNGQCNKCKWDGSTTPYIESIKSNA